MTGNLIQPDLEQAARFHCNHLAINEGGLSHKTFCELEEDIETACPETACPGAEASCSCVAGRAVPGRLSWLMAAALLALAARRRRDSIAIR